MLDIPAQPQPSPLDVEAPLISRRPSWPDFAYVPPLNFDFKEKPDSTEERLIPQPDSTAMPTAFVGVSQQANEDQEIDVNSPTASESVGGTFAHQISVFSLLLLGVAASCLVTGVSQSYFGSFIGITGGVGAAWLMISEAITLKRGLRVSIAYMVASFLLVLEVILVMGSMVSPTA